MNFYTHVAQGRIRGCILKSFIQIPIFVSDRGVLRPVEWHGRPLLSDMRSCRCCKLPWGWGFYAAFEKNAAGMFILNSLRAFSWLLRVFSCIRGARRFHTSCEARQGNCLAWCEEPWRGAKNVITVWKYFTRKSGRSGWDSSTTFITTSVKNWNWSNSESFCCKS